VSPEARHFGIDPGFINEHDVADLARMSQKPAQTFAPNRPCRLHIGALLFTGVCGFSRFNPISSTLSSNLRKLYSANMKASCSGIIS
jgi:hypothetical protein